MQEAQGPTNEELGWRDPSGMYNAEQPFWAPVSDAKYLTTNDSEDRKVCRAAKLGVEIVCAGNVYIRQHRKPSSAIAKYNCQSAPARLVR